MFKSVVYNRKANCLSVIFFVVAIVLKHNTSLDFVALDFIAPPINFLTKPSHKAAMSVTQRGVTLLRFDPLVIMIQKVLSANVKSCSDGIYPKKESSEIVQ